MEYTKCKTFGYKVHLHRNGRSDVMADNRADLNALRATHHYLHHHPLTSTYALHCVYQNTYYLVFRRVSVSTDTILREASLIVVTSRHSKYLWSSLTNKCISLF